MTQPPASDRDPKGPRWRIKANGREYGPYSLEQMGEFAEEGRLAGHSTVAPEGREMWRQASEYAVLKHLFETTEQPAATNPAPDFGASSAASPNNFVIVLDLISGNAQVTRAIQNFGQAYRLETNVWLVRAYETVGGVRNALAPHLQYTDKLFVADMTNNKTAWSNYGPELDSKLNNFYRAKFSP